MHIADILRKTLIKVRPEAPIGHVLIWYGGMDHVFRNTYVVDHCDRLLGVVTIHQILSIIVPPSVGEQARAGQLDGREQLLDALRRNLTAISETPVGHLMDADYPFAHPEALFVMASELVVEKGITALPVIDPNGVLVGEITRRIDPAVSVEKPLVDGHASTSGPGRATSLRPEGTTATRTPCSRLGARVNNPVGAQGKQIHRMVADVEHLEVEARAMAAISPTKRGTSSGRSHSPARRGPETAGGVPGRAGRAPPARKPTDRMLHTNRPGRTGCPRPCRSPPSRIRWKAARP